METYLINLHRCPERLEKMKQALMGIDVKFERIEAVDSKKLSQLDLSNCKSPNFEYPYELKNGEVACFLSHRKCWEKLVNSKSSWGLILEDHCVLSPNARLYLQSTEWIPEECKLVQFVFSQKPVFFRKKITLPDGNSLLNAVYTSPIGTSGYFISRYAAEIAIEYSKKILSPIDNYLFGSWSRFSKQVPYWRLCGAIIKRDPSLPTTIEDRNYKYRKIYPTRCLIKANMNLQRCFLKKDFQFWY